MALVLARGLPRRDGRDAQVLARRRARVARGRGVPRRPDPRVDPEGHAAGPRVAAEEGARYFVPVASPAAAISDAAAKPALAAVGCESLHFGLATCGGSTTSAFCGGGRLRLPPRPCCSRARGRARAQRPLAAAAAARPPRASAGPRYVLKNLEYDSQHRLDLFQLPCAPDALDRYLAEPHRAVRALAGDAVAGAALPRRARVHGLRRAARGRRAHADRLGELGVAAQLRPRRPREDRGAIAAFAAKTRLTGMLCWDFIDDELAGAPFPIGAPARAHAVLGLPRRRRVRRGRARARARAAAPRRRRRAPAARARHRSTGSSTSSSACSSPRTTAACRAARAGSRACC